jgi:hypothetical protein
LRLISTDYRLFWRFMTDAKQAVFIDDLADLLAKSAVIANKKALNRP